MSDRFLTSFLRRWIFDNWQRKALALMIAIVLWVLVDRSIVVTKTFVNVPIRIVNLPSEKTIDGLMSNGFLSRRMAITLTGYKDSLSDLQSKDLEVVIDAHGKSGEWIPEISKRDIKSVDPQINLAGKLTEISYSNFNLRLENLVTEKIPITILRPIGEPPAGYQFLDIWPRHLYYTISGPEEQVKKLKAKGLELTFNLSDIAKEDLDILKTGQVDMLEDEVTYFVPDGWKKVRIPFMDNQLMPIDDEAAKSLQMDFLRNSLLLVERKIPVDVFYPWKDRKQVNPLTYSLEVNELIEEENGVHLLSKSLFALNVSRLFLDIVRERMQIIIVAAEKLKPSYFTWGLQYIDPQSLEDRYVALLTSGEQGEEQRNETVFVEVEYLRERFRTYMRRMQLCNRYGIPLRLQVRSMDNKIIVTDVTPSTTTQSK